LLCRNAREILIDAHVYERPFNRSHSYFLETDRERERMKERERERERARKRESVREKGREGVRERE